MVTEGEDHQPVFLFTKDNMDADKPVSVVNCPPVRFIGGPSKKERTVNIKGVWYQDISGAVVPAVDVPMEEALLEIGMNFKRAVMNL